MKFPVPEIRRYVGLNTPSVQVSLNEIRYSTFWSRSSYVCFFVYLEVPEFGLTFLKKCYSIPFPSITMLLFIKLTFQYYNLLPNIWNIPTIPITIPHSICFPFHCGNENRYSITQSGSLKCKQCNVINNTSIKRSTMLSRDTLQTWSSLGDGGGGGEDVMLWYIN